MQCSSFVDDTVVAGVHRGLAARRQSYIFDIAIKYDGFGVSMTTRTGKAVLALAAAMLAINAVATPKNYSPYVERRGMEQVYWGDTHLHTAYSTDAGMIGNRLGPDAAYRFARGEAVVANSGQPARLSRPLDFLVVSDHAENLGLAPMIAESNPDLLKNPWGKAIHDLVKTGKGREAFLKWGVEAMLPRKDPIADKALYSSIWQRLTAAAERYNDPGNFTALIGFEWTSTPEGNNLHRVVIMRDGAERANQVIPMSQYDSTDPEDLWRWMADYEKNTGGSILAIPHNGNLSNGLMFDDVRYNGEPMTADYARRRQRWEPLAEVTQIKGDGEAHPALSPTDEFADYGTWDKGNIASSVPKQEAMLAREYARPVLKRGLNFEQTLGVNPFQFGMIGASDSHTSLSTTRDDNYFGKFSGNEPSADRWKHYVIQSISGDDALSTFAYEEVASGLAGVWATENTREALFDAMRRREVYATTGPRITVRFFGGSHYSEDDLNSPEMAAIGYRKGVPMGGLLPGNLNRAPVFMLAAQRDPDGANLDRIQVVKGWLDKRGQLQERIYDVVASDGRKPNPQGRVDALTSTVKKASYSNRVGAVQLQTLWTDPDFDPTLRAVYYLRVLEIPTPSWQAYDEQYFGVTMPEQVTREVQGRAYSSPIWYTPTK